MSSHEGDRLIVIKWYYNRLMALEQSPYIVHVALQPSRYIKLYQDRYSLASVYQ